MSYKFNLSFYKKIHILSNLVGVLTVALPILFWNKIPEQIPSHFNGAGVADNWSDKSSIVLLFFAVFMLMGLTSIAVYFVKSNMDSKYSSDGQRSQMHIVYSMLTIMNLILMIMFAYIMFCCMTCKSLGVWFLPVFLVGTAAPIVYMIYKCGKVKEACSADLAIYKQKEKKERGIMYRSAVDWWLGLILLGSEFMLLWFAIEPMIKKGEIDWATMLIAIGTSLILIPLFDIKYILYSEHMLVSMSIYGKARVRYKDIVSVKKTFNPLSSAALSLKRTQIDYVENGCHQMILISPKMRNDFLQILKEKAPHVKVES